VKIVRQTHMPALPLLPSPRASRWEWAQAALLVANLGWTTLANGGYGARIELVTVLLAGALVVVHAIAAAQTRGATHALHPAGWLLLPFLVYALANVWWITPVPWLGWRDWLGWAQLIAVFWIVLNGIRSSGPRRMLFYALVALGIVGVLLGCYQRFVQPEWRMVGTERPVAFLGRASGSFGIPNSFAGYLLLLLPAVAALTLRRTAAATERVWWGWVGLVLSFGFVLTLSRGAWLSLVLALPVWPLLAARGGWRRRAGLALGVFLVLVATGAVIVTKYPNARERFSQLVADSGEVTRPLVWRGAWLLFRDAPAFGTGSGSYNVLFEKYRPERFRDEPMWAHNEYLNTLSDYGAVGFLLFFGAVGVIAVRCAMQPRPEKRGRHGLADPFVVAGFGAGLLAFSLQMSLDFHLKIPALALSCAVVAALAVGAAWPGEAGQTKSGALSKFGWFALATTTVVAVLFFFRPMLGSEALRTGARRAIDRLSRFGPEHPDYGRTLPAARTTLLQATARDHANAQAWADLACATALLAHVEPTRTAELGREAEVAADRALQLSGVCGEFWIRRGVARNMQGRWAEAGSDFAKAVAQAPADATTWYYYADHLFRRPFTQEAGEAALNSCLRLDPWNHGGVILRQRLAINSKPP
jgi:O-antigen ligase